MAVKRSYTMAQSRTKQIGEDQFVYGRPKHMAATATGKDLGDPPYRPKSPKQDNSEKVGFWSVHPKPGACEKCRKMEGIKYAEKPERPHPNCKCEIKRHEANRQKRYLSGFIEGFEGNAVHLFEGYGHVRVRIKHITGAVGSGVQIWTNRAGVDQGHTLGGASILIFMREMTSFGFGTFKSYKMQRPTPWCSIGLNMRCKHSLLLAVVLLFSMPARANGPAAFYLGCEQVETIVIELAYAVQEINRENPRRVVGCEIRLTTEGGTDLDAHCRENWGGIFPVRAGDRPLVEYDSRTRSIPPKIFFTGDTWEEVRDKLMAICPDKIPKDIPQRVLDHRPE